MVKQLHTEASRRRYRLRHLLGVGGFGKVYHAEMIGPGGFSREVAIKLLNPTRYGSEEPLRRLRDEARVLGLIRHRAVVGIHGLARFENGWGIVMEFVEGVDAGAVVSAGPSHPRVVLAMIEEIASVLRIAWEQPVGNPPQPLHLVHRDIKPSNLRLTPDGAVKVLDFGTAKGEFAAREAQSEALLFGSVRYMAPERFTGNDGPGGDVWSLGLVMAELLFGRQVLANSPGEAEHARLVTLLRNELPRQLDGVAPAHLQSILDLLLGMLAFDVQDRLEIGVVEHWAQQLWTQLPGPTLRDWSRTVLPELLQRQAQGMVTDAMSGTILMEGEGFVERQDAPGIGPWLLGASAVFTALGGMGMVVLLGVWWMTRGEPAVAPVVAVPVAASPAGGETAEATGSGEAGGGGTGGASTAAGGGQTAANGRQTSTATRTAPDAGQATRTTASNSTGQATAGSSGQTSALPATSATTPVSVVPVPTSTTGRVTITGDGKATLEGGGKTYTPGEVPPGSYRILVVFGDEKPEYAGKVTVAAGETKTVRCSAAFRECR